MYGHVPSSAQFLCNIWLHRLTLCTNSYMVAPSINMIGPLVMVVPHIVCILLCRLWLRLRQIWLHHLICLRCLTLRTTNRVAPSMDMVALLVTSEEQNFDLAKLIFIRVRYVHANPINFIS